VIDLWTVLYVYGISGLSNYYLDQAGYLERIALFIELDARWIVDNCVT
jgi:hypothetical protein